MKRLIILSSLLLAISFTSFSQIEKQISLRGAVGFGDYKSSFAQSTFVIGKHVGPVSFIGIGTGIGYGERYESYSERVEFYPNTGTTVVDFVSENIITVIPMPIFLNASFDISPGDVSPFFAVNAGYTFDLYLTEGQGLMFNPYLGIKFGKNNGRSYLLSAGVNMQQDKVDVLEQTTYSDNSDYNFNDYIDKVWLTAFEVKLGYSF